MIMENEQFDELVKVFKEYRDLLVPIEQSLQEFSATFGKMKEDVQSLNATLDEDLTGKLEKIYKDLSYQAEKSREISNSINKFEVDSAKYISSIDRLVDVMSKVESRIRTVDDIQKKAEEQIGRLDALVEEKKKTYNLKQLEKNLETYNIGVQKVSEYINKDVAESLKANSDTIQEIKDKNISVYEVLCEEKQSIDKLTESYVNSNELLRKVVEKNDVNEEYIFSILDKWAIDRKVKTKK